MARPTLASRTALVTTAVAVAAVLIAGVLSYSLSRIVAERAARTTLAEMADDATTRTSPGTLASRPGLLRTLHIGLAVFTPDGTLQRTVGAARAGAGTVLSQAEIRQVIGRASC